MGGSDVTKAKLSGKLSISGSCCPFKSTMIGSPPLPGVYLGYILIALNVGMIRES